MGSSKGGGTTIGYRYYMTLQILLGRGPLDEVVEIKVGDKTAWPFRDGESSKYGSTLTASGVTSIQAPKLFGGDKSEGGIEGSLTVMMGDRTQIYPAWFKNLLGGNVPDFRGMASMVFDGMICALNPYPKKWMVRTRRALAGWDGEVWQPSYARIVLNSDSGTSDALNEEDTSTNEATDYTVVAMNGVHILYECVTNRSWGRGYDRSRINETSWLAAAKTLYNEKFGLCIAWKRDSDLEEFIGEVIKHIGASMYVSRETGLLELDLIRDDYSVEDLPLFTYNTGLLKVESPETSSLTDAVGEVIVTYHDPVTDRDMQVRAQNLAVIQSGEGVNSQKVSYRGVPTMALASRVAQRDLRAQSAENGRYKVYLDRRAWRLYPGAVFRIAAPDRGIANLVLRAVELEDKVITDGHIECQAVLDVFGLPNVEFTAIQSPVYTKPDKSAEALDRRKVYEATYYDIYINTTAADRAYLEATDTAIGTLAGRAKSLSLSYNILSKTGTEAYVDRGAATFAPTALLASGLGYYNGSLTFMDGFDLGLVEDGMLIMIDDEIMQATAVTIDADGVSGTIEITRGVLDTVPAQHAYEAPIFFLDGNVGSDNREYLSGETVSVKLLANTSSAQLDESLAAVDSVALVGRQARPYPPGAVFIINAASVWTPAFNGGAYSGNFSITWTHRDRLTQADQVVGHFDANVGPEAGTTYTLRFYNATSGALIRTVSGITTNVRAFTSADTTLVGSMRVELESVRDGLVSAQKYSFTMSRTL